MSLSENIYHPFINALGWSLLHSIWQFVLIALVWRLLMAFTGRHPAATRYRLSLVALLAIPLTFVLTFIRQWGIYANARQVVSLQFEEAGWYASAGESGLFVIDKSYPLFLDRLEAYTPMVFWAYSAGLLLFSLHGLLAYYKVWSLRTRNTGHLPEKWKARIPSLAKKAGVFKRIPVRVSTRVDIPAVVGFIKPVVLVPAAMLTGLGPDQVEAILLHEFRHIYHRDHYINILQNVLEILFFFHPATWWISRRLRDERENRIDEWVVGETGTPLAYAQALVHIESGRSSTPQPVLAATQSKNLLLLRIKNIMTMKTRSFKPGKNLAALAIILGATLSLAWFDPSKSINAYAYPDSTHLTPYGEATGLQEGRLPRTTESLPADPPATPLKEEHKPSRVVLKDGSQLGWEELSEEDRQQVLKAMEETRIAISKVNEELIRQFNSEEFRQQMAQVQEEVRRSMEEADRELQEHFESEEFRREMEKVGEEVRRAMEEVHEELRMQFESEEFREEMRKAGEEVRKAMEEVHEELRMQFESEEFREEMRKAGEEVRKAMEELGRELQLEFESEAFREEIRKAAEELRKALEEAAKQPQGEKPENK